MADMIQREREKNKNTEIPWTPTSVKNLSFLGPWRSEHTQRQWEQSTRTGSDLVVSSGKLAVRKWVRALKMMAAWSRRRLDGTTWKKEELLLGLTLLSFAQFNGVRWLAALLLGVWVLGVFGLEPWHFFPSGVTVVCWNRTHLWLSRLRRLQGGISWMSSSSI